MSSPETYRRHRFPIEVVEHCVWLYFRFALSYRNIEDVQRFLSLFESLNAPFRLRRHLTSARLYRQRLQQAFQLWHTTALATPLP